MKKTVKTSKVYSAAAAVFLTAVLLLSGCSGTETVPPEEIELSIRNILEFPTCEQIYRDIVYFGEEQKVLFLTTVDKRLLFSVEIRIQAGIRRADLIDVKPAGISSSGKQQVIVSIPKAEILLADADENTIEEYFLKEWGGQISRLEYYDEISRKKDELCLHAVETGLLDRAADNAETLIRRLLAASGIEVVEFRRVPDE